VLTVEAYDGFGRKGTKTYKFNVSSPGPGGQVLTDGNADGELSDNDGTRAR
jgi:hypothetical protein